MCKYDFLEAENEGKKLNEINNINNHFINIEVNNNENNNNEINNNENNINEINNNENNAQQNNFMIMSRTINVISSSRVATSEENLREGNI